MFAFSREASQTTLLRKTACTSGRARVDIGELQEPTPFGYPRRMSRRRLSCLLHSEWCLCTIRILSETKEWMSLQSVLDKSYTTRAIRCRQRDSQHPAGPDLLLLLVVRWQKCNDRENSVTATGDCDNNGKRMNGSSQEISSSYSVCMFIPPFQRIILPQLVLLLLQLLFVSNEAIVCLRSRDLRKSET